MQKKKKEPKSWKNYSENEKFQLIYSWKKAGTVATLCLWTFSVEYGGNVGGLEVVGRSCTANVMVGEFQNV